MISPMKNITTIINTHDMNSVMEIGETVSFKQWLTGLEKSKSEVLKSNNEDLHDFIFASPFLQKLLMRLGRPWRNYY